MKQELQAQLNAIRSPKDIMSFFDSFISYGCIDKDGERYVDSLGGSKFREYYRTLSLEDSLDQRIGACIEQTNITSFLLNRLGITNEMYCIRGQNEEHPAPNDLYLLHCYTLTRIDGQIVCIEHSDSELRGIYHYASQEQAIQETVALFGGKFRAHGATELRLHRYDEPVPGGLSVAQFNSFMNATGESLSFERDS